MNNTAEPIGPGAAIRAILRAQSVRIYAETPSITLLGLEDELAARIAWRVRVGKMAIENDSKALANVKVEIARRDVSEELVLAREEFQRKNKIWSYFPDEGPLRRELYPKHMAFIGATKEDDEILFMAANKVGKSLTGAYITTCLTTGRYPHWWHGRRFETPITAWIVNKTAKDVRDINEAELVGPPGEETNRGTAMIPAHLIHKCTPKPGTPNGLEFIQVKHVSGGISHIQSKSYDQGREAFQGRNIFFIWDDEEIPLDCMDEQRLRIMTTSGLICLTYTPINGLTEVTIAFMEAAGLNVDDMRNPPAALEEDEA